MNKVWLISLLVTQIFVKHRCCARHCGVGGRGEQAERSPLLMQPALRRDGQGANSKEKEQKSPKIPRVTGKCQEETEAECGFQGVRGRGSELGGL